MSFGHCIDCRHIGRADWVERGKYLRCEQMSSDGGEPEYPETKAYAIDAEEYVATVLVDRDFGCVMFERSEFAGGSVEG